MLEKLGRSISLEKLSSGQTMHSDGSGFQNIIRGEPLTMPE